MFWTIAFRRMCALATGTMLCRWLPLGLVCCVCAPACCERHRPPTEAPEPDAGPASPTSRCAPVGEDYVVGPRNAALDSSVDNVLPFASEVGDGVAFDRGFAVGALRQQGAGTEAIVITASVDATQWRTQELGLSHGDADPPRMFARGPVLGAAMLEPTGASRTLRLFRLDQEQVRRGLELLQGLDESLAFDVQLGERVGVAVWDAVPKDRDVSAIYLAAFDPSTLDDATAPHVVTLLGTDAEAPRVIERDAGFWLFWVARRPAPKQYDVHYRAEDIDYRYLEAMPLDATGKPVGAARRIGSSEGHVQTYDVARGADGAAIVVWRDDDTPSGSAGGVLLRALVRLGGIDGPDVIDDERSALGTPRLMQGWLASADARGDTRFAPISDRGELLDALRGEDLLGAGQPLANRDDRIFVSRFAGTSVRLFVAQCVRTARDAATAPDTDP